MRGLRVGLAFAAGGASAALLVGVPVGVAAVLWPRGAVPPDLGWTDPAPGLRPVPDPPAGPLSGLVVYLSAGHGYLLHRVNHDGDPLSYGRQRDVSYGMVEDAWTAQFVADWLAPELEARGATVIALRERDRNPERLVAEDEVGDFGATGRLGAEPDPTASSGVHSPLMPGGTASWTLRTPHAGHWYVAARWVARPGGDPRATYTTVLGDAVSEVVVDQRAHGGHWWPLLDACVDADTEVTVTLTGSGVGAVSADAVKLGGGQHTLVLPWSLEVRTNLQADMAMAHQLEALGDPAGLAAYECGTTVSDMRLRPHWASSVHPPGEEAIYLSIHTNASPVGRARGLTVFYGVDGTPPTQALPESVRLAKLVEEGVYDAVHAADPAYVTRGTRMGDYSEISPLHDALPSALLEMGFHDDPVDAARLQTPQFQRDAARGLAEGVVAWREGVPAGVDLPLGPPGASPPPADWARRE